MKKLNNIKTRTYMYTEDLYIDIVETPTDYESYLYAPRNCVKMFMFGCPIYQQSYDQFVEMVKECTYEYIPMYCEDYT